MHRANNVNKKRKSPENIENKPEKLSRMTANQSKTPITLLQEICAKKNSRDMPVYTEIEEAPDEYTDQNLRFFIKCQALGHVAIGGGVTKKIAKHTSAEKLLKKCFSNHDSDDDMHSHKSLESNSISDLLYYCVQKGYHKPEFNCISTCGPSHAPTFVFECKLNSIKRTATAGSKQLAKQLSAKEVLDILKSSYPDVEKKVAILDDKQQTDETIRHKISSYLDLKKNNKVETMGTSIKDRHKFFRTQEEEFVDCLTKILISTELNERQKYDKLLEELETMWPYTIEKFVDSELLMFKLDIDYEKFTCVLVGSEDELWREVLEYFTDMLNVDTSDPFDINEGAYENISLQTF